MTPEEMAAAAAAEAAKATPPASPPATPPADDKKTYTQEELNAIAKREKDSGRLAILKELGLEGTDVKSYKEGLAEFKKHQEAQKTETQKATEKATAEEAAKAVEKARADKAEAKLSVLTAGAKSEFIEDITILVQARVSDSKTFDQALADVKAKHPSYFNVTTDVGKGKGTGGKPNPGQNDQPGKAGLGQRLAQAQKPATENKSSYFKSK
jgi:hypothetical protein